MILLTGEIDLAQPRLGASVLFANDDFFAEAKSLIKPDPPIFIPDKFTDRGKWMDGWESRRRRVPGHDYCVLRICRGTIKRVNVDTSHFTGNFPEAVSIDAADSDDPLGESAEWHEIVSKRDLKGDSHNLFEIASRQVWNHLKIHIYPDGGVARLRVYGHIYKNWNAVGKDEVVDLVSMESGGIAVACSDMHFGEVQNLTAPGRSVNMGDGWETKRRRGPGHDWAILALGKAGRIRGIDIDTSHFKGNYPATCAVLGVMNPDASAEELVSPDIPWQKILPDTAMQADRLHRFSDELVDRGAVSHVKLEMHPDGGIGRLRVYGTT